MFLPFQKGAGLLRVPKCQGCRKLSPKKDFRKQGRHRWYLWIDILVKPGFGFDSGPNLKPWILIFSFFCIKKIEENLCFILMVGLTCGERVSHVWATQKALVDWSWYIKDLLYPHSKNQVTDHTAPPKTTYLVFEPLLEDTYPWKRLSPVWFIYNKTFWNESMMEPRGSTNKVTLLMLKINPAITTWDVETHRKWCGQSTDLNCLAGCLVSPVSQYH